MRNVVTPFRFRAVLVDVPGGPTVREADLLAGTGWPKKPMPAAERQQETVVCVHRSFSGGTGDNWPDTGWRAGGARAREGC